MFNCSYFRYVIGDSVVYGSPGRDPRDLYDLTPPGLKTPPSPQQRYNNSSNKNYSRYSPQPSSSMYLQIYSFSII